MTQEAPPTDPSEMEPCPTGGAKDTEPNSPLISPTDPVMGGDDEESKRSDADLESTVKAAADVIEREVLSLSARPVDQMVDQIATYGSRASGFRRQAEEFHILGRLNRWATGRTLLMVKDELDHGEFEEWLQLHRDKLGFGKSSAENYMKLARKFPTATEFLEEGDPLREFYSQRKSEDEVDDLEPAEPKRKTPGPSKTEALMQSLTNLQKRLRLVTESDEKIAGDQLVQLKLVKTEIDDFFKMIFPKTQ